MEDLRAGRTGRVVGGREICRNVKNKARISRGLKEREEAEKEKRREGAKTHEVIRGGDDTKLHSQSLPFFPLFLREMFSHYFPPSSLALSSSLIFLPLVRAHLLRFFTPSLARFDSINSNLIPSFVKLYLYCVI